MEIKGYKILREISRGPVTTVYLAEQTALERQVLLKVLNVQWKEEHELIERFRREAKISARLRHPNIVNIYDFGISGDHFYISMEYITGVTLAQFIHRNHPLPPQIVLFVMREILSGLHYAHERGVIHRDIKPSNILIEEGGTVKIADFGMATITDIPGLTEQGSAVGSPAYMSPEQAMGKKIRANSDIFSLAVTVYEMFVGHSPFRGAHVAESIHKTLNENPPPLHAVREDVPEWVALMVAGMLEKDPEKRTADYSVLLNQLNSIRALPDQESFAAYLRDPKAATFIPLDRPETVSAGKKPAKGRRPLWYVLSAAAFVLLLFFVLQSVGENEQGVRQAVLPDTEALKQPPAINLKPDTTAVEMTDKRPLNAVRDIQDTAGKGRKNTPRITERKEHTSAGESDEKAAPAMLFVVCTPWADVYIDDQKVDTTPLREALSLTPGRYRLRLQNPAFPVYQTDLVLQPAQRETLRVTLQSAVGYLNLRVHPWAKVYIDGVYRETTPLSAPIPLREGKHAIKLENPAFHIIEDTVWIEAGKTSHKRWRFKK